MLCGSGELEVGEKLQRVACHEVVDRNFVVERLQLGSLIAPLLFSAAIELIAPSHP